MSTERSDPNPATEPQPLEQDRAVEQELGRRTRRSFLVAAATTVVGYAGWRWLKTSPEVDGIPGPLRTMLGWNEAVSRRLLNPNRRMAERPESMITPGGPRANGDIGLDSPVDLTTWRLRIGNELSLTLADLKTLPEVTQITPLHCIEGWTTVARWSGVRLADFTDKFYPAGRSKGYVALTTPDNAYYVGLDAPSAFHPQTLLCYAINDKPLTNAHGSPLRLLIPTKYGVKNLKRVGQIDFSDERPPDYWAEQGYDWYAGF